MSAVARQLKCQPAYLSQIASGKLPLSLEHVLPIRDALGWSEEEGRYFMLLVQRDRAGTPELARHFGIELGRIRERRDQIAGRIEKSEALSEAEEARYYSSWFYAAIHILVAMPKYRSRAALMRMLNIEGAQLDPMIEFLSGNGLITKRGNELDIGTTRLHLKPGSPHLMRHHANWKLRAIEACDRMGSENLHYSGIIGLSKRDQTRLKTLFLDFIAELEKVVRASPFEEPYVINLDLFDLASSR